MADAYDRDSNANKLIQMSLRELSVFAAGARAADARVGNHRVRVNSQLRCAFTYGFRRVSL